MGTQGPNTEYVLFQDVCRSLDGMFRPGALVTVEEARTVTNHVAVDVRWRHQWLFRLNTLIDRNLSFDPITKAAWQYSAHEQWGMKSAKGDQALNFAVNALWTHFHPDSGSIYWWTFNRVHFIRGLLTPGSHAAFVGDMGTGKTDLVLKFDEILIDAFDEYWKLGVKGHAADSSLYHIYWDVHRGHSNGKRLRYTPENPFDPKDEKSPLPSNILECLGVRFPTNIAVTPNSDPDSLESHFQRATRLSDQYITAAQDVLAGLQPNLDFDEAGFAYNRKRTMSRHSMAIEQTVQRMLRKMFLTLKVSTQDKTDDLPDALQRTASTVIEKIDPVKPERGLFTIKGFFSATLVRGIPKTRINYRTRAWAAVTVDFAPSDLAEYLAGLQDQAADRNVTFTDRDSYRAMIAWLKQYRLSDDQIAAGALDEQSIRFYLSDINRQSGRLYSVPEVANLTGRSPDEVKAVQKKMADEVAAARAKKGRAPSLPPE